MPVDGAGGSCACAGGSGASARRILPPSRILAPRRGDAAPAAARAPPPPVFPPWPSAAGGRSCAAGLRWPPWPLRRPRAAPRAGLPAPPLRSPVLVDPCGRQGAGAGPACRLAIAAEPPRMRILRRDAAHACPAACGPAPCELRTPHCRPSQLARKSSRCCTKLLLFAKKLSRVPPPQPCSIYGPPIPARPCQVAQGRAMPADP